MDTYNLIALGGRIHFGLTILLSLVSGMAAGIAVYIVIGRVLYKKDEREQE